MMMKLNEIELNELNEFSKGKNIKIKKPKFGTFCGFLFFYKKPKKHGFLEPSFTALVFRCESFASEAY
jgi:hypothetical protein